MISSRITRLVLQSKIFQRNKDCEKGIDAFNVWTEWEDWFELTKAEGFKDAISNTPLFLDLDWSCSSYEDISEEDGEDNDEYTEG